MITRKKLSEKEITDMKQDKVIPEVAYKINDKAALDFIINACIL